MGSMNSIINSYYDYKANYNIGILIFLIIAMLITLMILIPIHYKDNNKYYSIGVAFLILIISASTFFYYKKVLVKNIVNETLVVSTMVIPEE